MALTAEDKLEIMELVARYNHAQDQNDYDGWVDTFTEDGVFESPQIRHQGREELRQLSLDTAAGIPHVRHLTQNFIIEGDGDEATMQSTIEVRSIAADRQSWRVVGIGNYEDDLRRVEGRWKFQRRFVRMLYWKNDAWP